MRYVPVPVDPGPGISILCALPADFGPSNLPLVVPLAMSWLFPSEGTAITLQRTVYRCIHTPVPLYPESCHNGKFFLWPTYVERGDHPSGIMAKYIASCCICYGYEAN
jgi:hypothetical protein